MTAEILVLRFVHVVGAIFWVGAILMNSLFLFPTLAEIGPAAGPVMVGLQRRKMMTVLPIVAILTILAGARLMSIAAAGSGGAYFQSRSGRTLAIGAAAGIISFLIGMFVGRPSAMRAGQLGAAIARASEGERAALAAELAAVNRRGKLAGQAVVVLLLVAAGAMAVARYVG
ncbi:MAG: putative rane protein [Gemmatimonadetes bacterium]|nr:putative rane protein [Gemmatimonadota bacterium]